MFGTREAGRRFGVGGGGGPIGGVGADGRVRVLDAGRGGGVVCGAEGERGRSGVPARGEEWVSGGILPMTGGPARN